MKKRKKRGKKIIKKPRDRHVKTRSKEFYIRIVENCIKSTYENWGIDMMSNWNNIIKEFPHASKAIRAIYGEFNSNTKYQVKAVQFENPQYVYEAISYLIPSNEEIYFNIETQEASPEYRNMKIYSWQDPVSIYRIDLLMAILLFTEGFILKPIKSKNVFFDGEVLTVENKYIHFQISKNQETYVDIKIIGVMSIRYTILN